MQLKDQEASISDQFNRTLEEQERLIEKQIQVHENLTKEDIKTQKEHIARLRKDVVDETTIIGETILKCAPHLLLPWTELMSLYRI